MIPIGSTAYNPQTGHQIVLTEKGWVDAGSPQMAASMSAPDQKSLTDLGEDARQAQWLAQKADQFRQIQQGGGPTGKPVGTGPLNGIPIIGDALTAWGAAHNPSFASMESISNQAWAHMRPQGQGPLKMPEVEGFKEAFPGVSHTPEANQAIDQRLDQDASTAAQKLQFIDTFIRQNRGTYADANAAWQRAQQSAISQQPLPPAAGQTQFGQPNYDTSGPLQYNAGQPAGAPQAQQQQPRVLTWNPQTGQLQ